MITESPGASVPPPAPPLAVTFFTYGALESAIESTWTASPAAKRSGPESATTMRPDGSTATPLRSRRWTPAPRFGPISNAGRPLGWNALTRLFPVSATTMRPDAGSTATPSGPLNEPIALPSCPNESSRVPLGWNATMSLRRVNATNMRPDRGSMATELGFERSLLTMPPCPNESSRVPLGWNALMRWRAVSATMMRPSGPTATPRGTRMSTSKGTLGYRPPNLKSNVALGWNIWIREFSVSATTMRPDAGSTATPRGIANSPSSAPRLLRLPIAKSYVPLGWNTLIAWFPRSATSMRPCASTAAPYGLCRGAPCSVALYAADAVVPTSTLPL